MIANIHIKCFISYITILIDIQNFRENFHDLLGSLMMKVNLLNKNKNSFHVLKLVGKTFSQFIENPQKSQKNPLEKFHRLW